MMCAAWSRVRRSRRLFSSVLGLSFALTIALPAWADPPSLAYLFPAGGQRRTRVDFRAGGYELHEGADFRVSGGGVTASPRIVETKAIWFEGPVLQPPASSRAENYARDYVGHVTIAADAELGPRRCRVVTSQGLSPSLPFVVGDLPETVEIEVPGDPIPKLVSLPITINGRIFPREDVDVWSVDLTAGQTVSCEVVAARIGSPLDSRLEVRDPSGRAIAENLGAFGADSFVRFTAAVAGRYEVRIHDAAFEGAQQSVYRLTLDDGPWVDAVYPLGGRRGTEIDVELDGANLAAAATRIALPAAGDSFAWQAERGDRKSPPVRFALSDLPEFVERADAKDAPTEPFALPIVINGRIERPGEVDEWAFAGTKGQTVDCDLQAERLGSPLDSVLTLLDADGKSVATNDDAATGQTDSKLAAKLPADGVYRLRVADGVSTRGGPRFAYRLTVTATDAAPAAPTPTPGGKIVAPIDFRIDVPVDALNVDRGGEPAKLKIDVAWLSGPPDEVRLEFEGLPAGITVTGTPIPKNRRNAQITLQADSTAPLGVFELTLVGRSGSGAAEVVRRAKLASPSEAESDRLILAVGVATPFKYVGEFETKYAPRGSVFSRKYKLERNGFEGPLEVRLADRQARHLQGVTGSTIVVPPGATEFEYAVSLAPWMTIGRTSRSCVTVVGVVRGEDGREHKVSYSSIKPNEQVIVIVDPGRLAIETTLPAVRLTAGASVSVPFDLARDVGLNGEVRVEAVVPEHWQGLRAAAVTVPAGETRGRLELTLDGDRSGPFTMPLALRAVTTDERGLPVVAETKLDLVEDR